METVNVIAAAEAFVVDEDLRDSAETRFFNEFLESFLVVGEVDFLVFCAEGVEKGFGFDAVWAVGLCVDCNHDYKLSFLNFIVVLIFLNFMGIIESYGESKICKYR